MEETTAKKHLRSGETITTEICLFGRARVKQYVQSLTETTVRQIEKETYVRCH